jgi:protein tyrosine phosphatase (PTP) superfamily phosphohydrolase (DUF442 family)
MKTSPASLSEIYSFRAIGERLGTAGQPTENQFRAVRQAGFEAVINLALPTSDNALANEGSIVTGLGMSYVHIPVDFKTPTSQDFQAFSRVMEAFENRRVFVHCAANMSAAPKQSASRRRGMAAPACIFTRSNPSHSDVEALNLMKTFLLSILAFCWLGQRVSAQESLPTFRILPEDVVQTVLPAIRILSEDVGQTSIEQVRSPAGTNKFAVRWTYTEAGAKKMLAFWRAHAGEKVLQQVGESEFRPTISTAKPLNWTEEGWLGSRTDKFFAVSEEDARKIVAGLKGK